ncbi:MAG: hypothetical protein M3Y49_02155 [Actinomycetota bacterium]|nr:hypothetical protein [Actinomycetota bacterium]
MDGNDKLLLAGVLKRRGIRPETELLRDQSRLARIRRGVYTDTRYWSQLQAAERYRIFVLATVECMRSAPIVSGLSAAAVWELPTVGRWPNTVEVLVARGGPGSTGNVARRRVASIPEPHQVGGVLVTSPARTVIDVARCADFAAALTVADAALRQKLCTPDDIDHEVELIPDRARGRKSAARVAMLADRLCESPGESLSRARMWELGLPQPRLQVPLHDSRGSYGRADFGWPGVIGEFDGKAKYGMQGIADEEAADVLWREKRREDRIRESDKVARWTWDDALRGSPMAQILARVGITPVPQPPPWVRGPATT